MPPRALHGRVALVTGAAGFIGSALTERLSDAGMSLVCVDVAAHAPGPDRRWLVRDARTLRAEDLPCRVDVVFHLAAVVGVRAAALDHDRTESVITDGTAAALAIAAEMGADFVFVSSSEVYGEPDELPTSERAALRPMSAYARAKARGEALVAEFAAAHPDLRATVIRPFNVYGPGQQPSFVIPRFVEQLDAGLPITLVGDGTQQRTFTYISDLVDGMVLAATRPSRGFAAYNIGGTETTTILGLAFAIARHLGIEAPRFDRVAPERLGRPTGFEVVLRAPDIGKAATELGYEPKVTLNEGLASTVEAFLRGAPGLASVDA